MNLVALTIKEARGMLDRKDITARALAEACLSVIEEKNPRINAFLEVYDDVRAQADAADARIQNGESTPLLGIPIALKDNILVKGKRASSASKILEGYVASYDATAVERLKAEGAVLLGRTNMDEFALGSSTENSAFGPTLNPLDEARVPGGSSGGSAAAVASGMCLGAFGSDTGGSVRHPASFCGLVGLKPTYGRVSRFGLMAAASSLDQIGPIAKTVDDAGVLFEAVQGHDAHDSTTLPNTFFSGKTYGAHKKIGVPRKFMTKGVDADVLEAFEASLARLASAGYEMVDIDLPLLDASLAVYYIINPAEVSTNLARFDGVRYGRAVEGSTVLETYLRSRGEGFGKEVRRRVLVGTYVLSSGYVDAYYRKAEAVRRMIRRDFENVFETVDAIATPTTPTPAFKLGEKEDPLSMYAADIFTVPINLAGVPALSVPSATVVRDGVTLPTGFQLVGPHGGEASLLSVARAVE